MLSGRIVDAVTGTSYNRFAVPFDAALPLPLLAFLPMGTMRVEATAHDGRRLHAEFERTDLQPEFAARSLQWQFDR